MRTGLKAFCALWCLLAAPSDAAAFTWLFKLGRILDDAAPRALPNPRVEPKLPGLGDDLASRGVPNLGTGLLDDGFRADPGRGSALTSVDDATLKRAVESPKLILENPDLRSGVAQPSATQKTIATFGEDLNNAIPPESRQLGVPDAALQAAQRQEVSKVVDDLLNQVPHSAFLSRDALEQAIKKQLESRAAKSGDPAATFNVINGKLKLKKTFRVGPENLSIEIELGEIPIYAIAVAAGGHMLLCEDVFCSNQFAAAVNTIFDAELRRRTLVRALQHTPN